MNEDSNTTARRIVLVSGPSGAGRSSALNVLEDAGFEAVDNLPLRLLPHLFEAAGHDRPLALGIDPRNREFSTNSVIDLLGGLAGMPGLAAELLYLDCSTDVLLRRYSETRRRHPLAPNGRPSDGIAQELQMLEPLRARADVLIDTSELNIHQLRAEVEHWFAPEGQRRLTVSVQSFSYKRGLPRSVDMIFDCRFLTNPYWTPSLRALNGTDVAVKNHVMADLRFAAFSDKVLDLSLLLLPAYREEGKSYFSIAFGCTGGQHRSVVMAQGHALQLAEAGWQVSIRHRELDLRKKDEA
ncbi:Nucleotide-binding protein YvcJ [Roseobacter fucihabitans]|uniref:Nucleotide-binding protein YvcJ n=1 Tax=Roseobacter fucihabitans TaxID=1537242 RepID=A0ABZ2BQB0_9RHOB|nr:RNase adapter RapZ [Roseobacter litoralis]MBC6964668.1 glmZ(sRNA)-inactivating NTPase [Roseobacter litoralis]